MGVGLALLAAPLAPVLDGHWLVGFHHVGDLQFRVDLGEHTKRGRVTSGRPPLNHSCCSPAQQSRSFGADLTPIELKKFQGKKTKQGTKT